MGEHILRVQHRPIYRTYNDFTRLPRTTILETCPLKHSYYLFTPLSGLTLLPANIHLANILETFSVSQKHPTKQPPFKILNLKAFTFCFILLDRILAGAILD